MRATTALASLFTAAACVSASSSSSHPVLAFTSQQAASTQLELPSKASIAGFMDSLLIAGKQSPACQLDAIAVVSVDTLDKDTFTSLRHTTTNSLRARSLNAPSQVTFDAQLAGKSIDYIKAHVSKTCGFESTETTSVKDTVVLRPSHDKFDFHFFEIIISDLRREESTLLQSLESLDEQYPRNLVIVAQNGGLHEHTKRQYVAPSSSNGNWTEPTGGIFAKYQLFSTPLILTWLLVGGLLLPIVYFAVSQLAQVETPDQMGARRDPISGDKKSQ